MFYLKKIVKNSLSQWKHWNNLHDNAFGISIKKDNLDKLHAMANEDFKDIDFGNKIWDVDFVRIAADTDIAKIIYDLEPYEPIWSQ